jgi:hypothetical protein
MKCICSERRRFQLCRGDTVAGGVVDPRQKKNRRKYHSDYCHLRAPLLVLTIDRKTYCRFVFLIVELSRLVIHF